MSLLPHRFLLRIAYPCVYVKTMPREGEDALLDLPEACRVDNFADMDGTKNFADVRLAWNERGLGIQAEVRGKERQLQGDQDRPRGSDGLTLWIDTRDARASHRASRYCHQFHFLPTGAGSERDQPAFVQTKINRALQDAPISSPQAVPFRSELRSGGYRVEGFLPAEVLNGFDHEQNPRMGFYYAVRDGEFGEQVLAVGAEFPYWEDPSLWSALVLVR